MLRDVAWVFLVLLSFFFLLCLLLLDMPKAPVPRLAFVYLTGHCLCAVAYIIAVQHMRMPQAHERESLESRLPMLKPDILDLLKVRHRFIILCTLTYLMTQSLLKMYLGLVCHACSLGQSDLEGAAPLQLSSNLSTCIS